MQSQPKVMDIEMMMTLGILPSPINNNSTSKFEWEMADNPNIIDQRYKLAFPEETIESDNDNRREDSDEPKITKPDKNRKDREVGVRPTGKNLSPD